MSNPVKVSAIVCMAENRCIGKNNDLPWHIPQDLKRFKALTMGKPVVMGRKTFESIVSRLGKPLPGRTNIVVSRSGFSAEGVIVCPDIEAAIEAAKSVAAEDGIDEIFIGGGAQIYALALPHTEKIYMTEVHRSVDGDVFFPVLDECWQETSRTDFDGDPAFSFLILEKK